MDTKDITLAAYVYREVQEPGEAVQLWHLAV